MISDKPIKEMKNIIFKNINNIEKGIKKLSIFQKNEDKESLTHIRKTFSYHVFKSNDVDMKCDVPQIYITKSFNTKKRIEGFVFKVQGSFYMTQNRILFKVEFNHNLQIDILWKNKVFSPKKSAVLT